MCGIFGVMHSTKAPKKDMLPLCKFMQDAVIVGVVRGDDSTGMFQVEKDRTVRCFKLPYSGEIFAQHQQARAIMNDADDSIITVGHHRAATRGAVSPENCHPFEHYDDDRHVIGVHNGFVNGMPWKQDGIDFQVDSDWLYYRIFRDGGAKAIGSMNGAMALAWYENDGRLRLYSNGHRSLYWAFMKDQDAMLFASEHGMLWWLAGDESRAGIDLDPTIFYPQDNFIYAFDPDNIRNPEKIPLEKPAAKSTHVRGAKDNTVVMDLRHDIIEGDSAVPLRPTRSFQNFPMNYLASAIKERGGVPDRRVEFLISNIYCRPNRSEGNVVGIIEIGQETVYALIPNCTETMIENMELAKADSKSRITAAICGIVDIYHDSKQHPGFILKNVSITLGDTSKLPAEDDGSYAEIVLDWLVVPGPRGDKISRGRFVELTQGFCDGCGNNITPQMAIDGQVAWINTDTEPSAVCADCLARMSGSVDVPNAGVLHDAN